VDGLSETACDGLERGQGLRLLGRATVTARRQIEIS
jgi:hypothetical protein